MKVTIALLVLAAAAGIWFWLARSSDMTPYPLIDPADFTSVLPGVPKLDASQYDQRYFDRYGYLKGAEGTAHAVASWSKRPPSAADPYDVDLSILITATPSPAVAAEGFALGRKQDSTTLARFVSPMQAPVALAGDQVTVQRMQVKELPPTYIVTIRHGNYLFRFSGRIAAGGHFETEAAFFDRMALLNSHIQATLQSKAMGT